MFCLLTFSLYGLRWSNSTTSALTTFISLPFTFSLGIRTKSSLKSHSWCKYLKDLVFIFYFLFLIKLFDLELLLLEIHWFWPKTPFTWVFLLLISNSSFKRIYLVDLEGLIVLLVFTLFLNKLLVQDYFSTLSKFEVFLINLSSIENSKYFSLSLEDYERLNSSLSSVFFTITWPSLCFLKSKILLLFFMSG